MVTTHDTTALRSLRLLMDTSGRIPKSLIYSSAVYGLYAPSTMRSTMVIFSVLLIVIVLYNSGNLSFNEREKEFATLKVLGFKSGAIRRLLSTQNLWLSMIGVICGIPLGRVPLQAMMDSNGDAVDWSCYIAPSTYIIAAIFVMTVSVLVSSLFSRRIKRIDMVEVLKGME